MGGCAWHTRDAMLAAAMPVPQSSLVNCGCLTTLWDFGGLMFQPLNILKVSRPVVCLQVDDLVLSPYADHNDGASSSGSSSEGESSDNDGDPPVLRRRHGSVGIPEAGGGGGGGGSGAQRSEPPPHCQRQQPDGAADGAPEQGDCSEPEAHPARIEAAEQARAAAAEAVEAATAAGRQTDTVLFSAWEVRTSWGRHI